MSDKSVEQMEAYVRKRWARVIAANTYAPGTASEIYVYGDSVPKERRGMQRPTVKIITGVNKAEAWQVAYAFTQRREQEIREKREEISLVLNSMQLQVVLIGNIPVPAQTKDRLIKMLEAQLADLLKGFKEVA